MASERREVALWPYVVGAIVVLVVGFFLARMWRSDNAKDAFEARVQKLRDAGEPTEAADLAMPFVPPERNANYQVIQAHKLLDAHEPIDWRSTHRAYLEQLERAALCDSAYADFHWAAPYMIRVPESRAMATASAKLRELADLWPPDATRCAKLQLELAERVRLPLVLFGMVTLECRANVIDILKAVAPSDQFDPVAFRRTIDPMIAGILRIHGADPEPLRAERPLLVWLGRHPEQMAAYFGEDGVRLKPLPFYESLHGKLDDIDQALAACGRTPEQALAMPADTLGLRWIRAYGVDAARLRLFRVAMALLAHRREHRRWPAAIGDLGAMPRDPYTGGSFAYVQTDKGVRLFVDDPRAADDERLRYEFE